MVRIRKRWLPPVRVMHPSPEARFAATPKVGAQCGNPARWDLRGGPPVRAVPTATQTEAAAALAAVRSKFAGS